MLPTDKKLMNSNYLQTDTSNLFPYYWSGMNIPIKNLKYLTLDNGHRVRVLSRKRLVRNIPPYSSSLLNKKDKIPIYNYHNLQAIRKIKNIDYKNNIISSALKLSTVNNGCSTTTPCPRTKYPTSGLTMIYSTTTYPTTTLCQTTTPCPATIHCPTTTFCPTMTTYPTATPCQTLSKCETNRKFPKLSTQKIQSAPRITVARTNKNLSFPMAVTDIDFSSNADTSDIPTNLPVSKKWWMQHAIMRNSPIANQQINIRKFTQQAKIHRIQKVEQKRCQGTRNSIAPKVSNPTTRLNNINNWMSFVPNPRCGGFIRKSPYNR